MTDEKVNVYILGAAGFGAGELMRFLVNHPRVESICAISKSHHGQLVHEVHPHLRGLIGAMKFHEAANWDQWRETPLAVFSAMPSLFLAKQWNSLEGAWSAAGLDSKSITVIDLSGDFRLKDATEFQRYYGEVHPVPSIMADFTYGLSEWRPERLYQSSRIANPGCFATAIELALLPLANFGDLGRVKVTAMTGSSGSGSIPKASTHHSTRSNNMKAYKVFCHQHLGEINSLLRTAGGNAGIDFVPVSAPISRGIFATVHVNKADLSIASTDAAELFQTYYAKSHFVRYVPEGPSLAAVLGTNFCDLTTYEKDGQLVVIVALDNLGKGMAGQAVQNLNLSRQWPENLGLRLAAPYP